jgi:hypothetical protein
VAFHHPPVKKYMTTCASEGKAGRKYNEKKEKGETKLVQTGI